MMTREIKRECQNFIKVCHKEDVAQKNIYIDNITAERTKNKITFHWCGKKYGVNGATLVL